MTARLAPHTDLRKSDISMLVLLAALTVFGQFCGALGGSLFNPAHNAAFIAIGKDSTAANVARMVAQFAGAQLSSLLRCRCCSVGGNVQHGLNVHEPASVIVQWLATPCTHCFACSCGVVCACTLAPGLRMLGVFGGGCRMLFGMPCVVRRCPPHVAPAGAFGCPASRPHAYVRGAHANPW